MPVALYLRVSTEEQRERQSIATQREFAERYCALHQVHVSTVYADDGVSGTAPLQEPLHRYIRFRVCRLESSDASCSLKPSRRSLSCRPSSMSRVSCMTRSCPARNSANSQEPAAMRINASNTSEFNPAVCRSTSCRRRTLLARREPTAGSE